MDGARRRKKGKELEVPCVYTFSGPHKILLRNVMIIHAHSSGF